MSEIQNTSAFNPGEILSRLDSIESRISQIEETIGIRNVDSKANFQAQSSVTKDLKEQKSFESQIGGNGLAFLGSIVLLFGIIFISQYIQNAGYPLFASIFGYLAVAGIMLLSYAIRNSVSHMSSMFNFIANILLYFVTVRLHFYVDNPLIESEIVSFGLLLGVTAYLFFYAFRKKSELYAIIAIALTITTAVISSNTNLAFSLVTIVSAITVLIFFRFGWHRVLNASIFLCYLTFLIWIGENREVFLNSHVPHPSELCHCFLLIIAGIFSIIALVREKEEHNKEKMLTSLLINGIFFTINLGAITLIFFTEDFSNLFIVISAFCILFSVILKRFSKWIFSPALYALYGFVAISVSVYGIFGIPDVFFYLAIESLLVVSMALWFKSKIIVSMNAVLFFFLLLAYFNLGEYENTINYAFAFSALVTARIINWKKDRLDIKTELLRNLYLIAAFGLVLFALYKSIPSGYVSLSWAIAAIVYFTLSIILKNVKYRWLAISTMISAALFLVFFELNKISVLYRILAFLSLAIISIGISLYYAKARKKPTEESENSETTDELVN